METNIQKMQALLETVRTGSFTRAAESLSYSQSGVSRMVADLETDWGFKVLERSRDGVALTQDGKQVMPAVEALCDEFGRLRTRIDEIRGLVRGKICIGTFSSVATHVLPGVVERMHARHPAVEFELLMGDYSEIERWVSEGRCDLGVIPRAPKREGLVGDVLLHDELMAVAPAQSELASLNAISLAELAAHPFMLLERGQDDEITPLFERAGVDLDAKFSTWDDYAIMAMVEKGLGVSILPALILRRNPYAIATRPLSSAATRTIYAIHRKEGLSLAARAFLDLLVEHVGDSAGL